MVQKVHFISQPIVHVFRNSQPIVHVLHNPEPSWMKTTKELMERIWTAVVSFFNRLCCCKDASNRTKEKEGRGPLSCKGPDSLTDRRFSARVISAPTPVTPAISVSSVEGQTVPQSTAPLEEAEIDYPPAPPPTPVAEEEDERELLSSELLAEVPMPPLLEEKHPTEVLMETPSTAPVAQSKAEPAISLPVALPKPEELLFVGATQSNQGRKHHKSRHRDASRYLLQAPPYVTKHNINYQTLRRQQPKARGR